MQAWIIRTLFFILAGIFGYVYNGIIGTATGLAVSAILVSIECYLSTYRLYNLLICVIGLTIGLIAAGLIIYLLSSITGITNPILAISLTLVLGYSGMMGLYYKQANSIFLSIDAEKNGLESLLNFRRDSALATKPYPYKILDTSIIIDGRIYDICQTGFIDGTIVIPRFVLKELQNIADSHEMLRRNKGRRGFRILQLMQDCPKIDVEILENDFPEAKDVDAKIVRLARQISAKVITNDFNLNKFAELQGITVLNVNELANSVKSVVVPGEVISVRIIREGKEYNQGVGYLDDGTMVIVENGKAFEGQMIDIVVTQTLQTSAGRMIFSRRQVNEEMKNNGENKDNSNYSSSWDRNKNQV